MLIFNDKNSGYIFIPIDVSVTYTLLDQIGLKSKKTLFLVNQQTDIKTKHSFKMQEKRCLQETNNLNQTIAGLTS
jgi:hypothetical protein